MPRSKTHAHAPARSREPPEARDAIRDVRGDACPTGAEGGRTAKGHGDPNRERPVRIHSAPAPRPDPRSTPDLRTSTVPAVRPPSRIEIDAGQVNSRETRSSTPRSPGRAPPGRPRCDTEPEPPRSVAPPPVRERVKFRRGARFSLFQVIPPSRLPFSPVRVHESGCPTPRGRASGPSLSFGSHVKTPVPSTVRHRRSRLRCTWAPRPRVSSGGIDG